MRAAESHARAENKKIKDALALIWLLAWLLSLMWMTNRHGGKAGTPEEAAGRRIERPGKHPCMSLINMCASKATPNAAALRGGKSGKGLSRLKAAPVGQ